MYFAELEDLYEYCYYKKRPVVFEVIIVLKSGVMMRIQSKPLTLPATMTVGEAINRMDNALQKVIIAKSYIPFEIFDGHVIPTEIAFYSVHQVS